MLTLLALAALTAAAPFASSAAPGLSSEFTLQMQYHDKPMSLGAIESGKGGSLYIVGFDPDVYRGTPVTMTGNDTNAVLSFNIGPGDDCETTQTGVFGISVPDMGELYGEKSLITAWKDGIGSEVSVGETSVFPHITAASQSWYACQITVQGKEYIGLAIGVYNSNGSWPYGCGPTSVKPVFDLPCDIVPDMDLR